MRKNKYLTQDIILVVIFTLILQSILSFIFVIDFSSRAYSQYEDYARFNIETSAVILSQEVASLEDESQNYAHTTIDQNTALGSFDIISVLSKQGITKSYSKSGAVDLTLSHAYYDVLTKNSLTIASLELVLGSEVLGLDQKELYSIHSKKIGEEHLLFFKSHQKFVTDLLGTGYENVIAARRDNVALYSSVPDILNTNLTNSLGIDITSFVETKLFQSKVSDMNVTIAVVNLGAELNNLRLIGYINSETIFAYVAANTARFILIVLILLAISVLAILVGLTLYVKRYKNLVIFAGKFKNHYNFYLKRNGEYLGANKAFKEDFDSKTILDKICISQEFSDILLSGRAFPVKLTSRNNQERFVNFMVINMFYGYKFVGGDCTELMKDFYDYKRITETDEMTGFRNYKALNSDFQYSSEGGLVLLQLFGVDKFKVMFGKNFCLMIVKKFSEKIIERLGGHGTFYFVEEQKFAIMFNQVEYDDFVNNIKETMDLFNQPLTINDNTIKLKARAGIIKLSVGAEFDQTFLNAENSLLKARDLLRATYFVYHSTEKDNLLNETMIKELLETEKVDINYQPQYSLKEKRIIGFEALCRIKDNSISIAQFIEKAELHGHMVALGDYIYDKAMQFASEIKKYGVSISINVSPIQMLQMGFTETFLSKYSKYNLSSGDICVEVTESFVMSSLDEMILKLQILRDNGIQIHLDDFGIAYSSMLYLKKLPINSIKIDREFIKDMEDNKYSSVIVSKIISICKELDLYSIAEGVETNSQRKLLEKFGCDTLQGYLISKAVDGKAAIALLEKQTVIEPSKAAAEQLKAATEQLKTATEQLKTATEQLKTAAEPTKVATEPTKVVKELAKTTTEPLKESK